MSFKTSRIISHDLVSLCCFVIKDKWNVQVIEKLHLSSPMTQRGGAFYYMFKGSGNTLSVISRLPKMISFLNQGAVMWYDSLHMHAVDE